MGLLMESSWTQDNSLPAEKVKDCAVRFAVETPPVFTAESAKSRRFTRLFHTFSRGSPSVLLTPLLTGFDTGWVWPAIPDCSGAGSRCITAPVIFFCLPPGHSLPIRGAPFFWSRVWCSAVSPNIFAGKSRINLLYGLRKRRKPRSLESPRPLPRRVHGSQVMRKGALLQPPRPELHRYSRGLTARKLPDYFHLPSSAKTYLRPNRVESNRP